MPRILSLDLASSTGWALGSTTAGVQSHGVCKLPKTGEDLGRFLNDYREWLRHAIEQLAPTEIIFESPILPAKTNLATTRKLYSLAGLTELSARDYLVPCLEANLSEIRKHFVGVARAPKEIPAKDRRPWIKARTVAECRKRGFRVAGDDEADALALLSLRLSQLMPVFDFRAPESLYAKRVAA